MYIKSARITNIRSIEDFEINFDEPAGWHVLIGDNGSGKSTIIRSLALALVGPDEAPGLRADWRDWVKVDEVEGRIELKIIASGIDGYFGEKKFQLTPNIIILSKEVNNAKFFNNNELKHEPSKNSSEYNWSNEYGWFSVAYGPYRRFTGGDKELDKIFSNQPKLGAHLSALDEAAALTEITNWLIRENRQDIKKLINALQVSGSFPQYKDVLEKQKQKDENIYHKFNLTIAVAEIYEGVSDNLITSIEQLADNEVQLKGEVDISRMSVILNLKRLLNSSKFLPNKTQLEKISSEGVFFRDGNNNLITINQLSDGYRSILSLTLELIRQLIRVYGEEAVFKNIREDKMYIDLPGVVLIDEIDAHLHPTWQTKIGQWFLKYFPNLQFIVTTHSPLVCRAAEKGTIWKLAAPGSGEKSEQVKGIYRDRLIYGNVLDAYGTEVFGKDVSISKEASGEIDRLAELNLKSIMGDTDENEEKELQQLKSIYPTEKVK